MEDGKIVVFGCGGHARSVISTLVENYQDKDIILVDDNAKEHEYIDGFQVLNNYSMKENDLFHVAIGDNNKRKIVFEKLIAQGIGKPYTIISNSAVIRETAQIGKGVFVSALAYVGPHSAIGDNTIINTGSLIEHEVIVDKHCHIAPHSTICGRTKIGENVFIGAEATIKDYIDICSDVIVGAGSTVVNSIEEKGIFLGVPAKRKGDFK